MLEILFCDIYKKFTDACTQQIKSNKQLQKQFKFSVYFGDIRDLKDKHAAYVSPANSFGSMGGGIDLLYSREMFPWINKVVMEKVSKLNTKVTLKRSFDNLHKGVEYPALAIGDAIITPLSDFEKYKTCFLITAPTMVLPSSIQGTNNPQKAFAACLNAVKTHNSKSKHKIKTIICPGLGTGVGGISGEESAMQIFDAIKLYKK